MSERWDVAEGGNEGRLPVFRTQLEAEKGEDEGGQASRDRDGTECGASQLSHLLSAWCCNVGM